ncbi:cytochrome b5 reductase 4-like protein [Euroglyphus maynei]|uniref:Cytochrome b5 reductase 4-like protein n=1 Tax=Euroglyphus maynei TaxID=6958 RepID=A0A1Y3B271_EURMA|nr:cytochrome b5 reductase 4-like protein [Euroglyphus maynei]
MNDPSKNTIQQQQQSSSSSSLLNVSTNVNPLLNINSGNATGSGRTKVALKPGYGLMGWVRFTSNAKNLKELQPKSVVDPQTNIITMNELSKHDQPDDCWIAIRGKVFNCTAYLDYHPGGMDELMKGAGKNATNMFEDVHSWVNYESLLEKCFIGRLADL